jgi:hypothetical protein
MRSPIKADIEGDAWVSRGNNRLRAEKYEKRILADMGVMWGKSSAAEQL